ncbi:RNA-protein complex protein Nop10 [Methanogenium cariaci]|uniref:RNA-protein complex protein Nop10 n=1 Tax=Methanogenium cariaci TaxID=2197 RepID=UPI0009F8CC92|nr:RNA-protein complex protein Nop10 [Methanogenium cariaci]
MVGKIRRCPSDGTYTLNFSCPQCGTETRTAHPARYSSQDRFGKYRRRVRYG